MDPITVAVSELPRSKAFHEISFAPLGYVLGFGEEGVFWAFDLGDGLFEIAQSSDEAPLTRVHVAFRVRSKGEVDAFHRAALEAGALDNGAPGPRPAYTENYYACFVVDPDGYHIEAMIDHRRG